MRISIIRDAVAAERLWKAFSPRECIYDDWNFRLDFFEPSGCELYFATIFQDARPLALLPLQKRPDGSLEFFGGSFMEDNRVFCRAGYETLARRLYESLPGDTELHDIGPRDPCRGLFQPETYTGYEYDLSGIKTSRDFLEHAFHAKSLANMKKKLRVLHEKWQLTVRAGVETDLEFMFELNLRRFGEDSAFNLPERRETFRRLFRRGPESVLLTLWAGGRKIGASFALGYRDSYVYLNAGVRHDEYPDTGTYLILENVTEALQRGKTLFDAGIEDLGWKERWHLRPVPRYRFRKAG